MTDNQDVSRLEKYMEEYWEYVLKHNPTFATYTGDHRYDDKIEDCSEREVQAQNAFVRDMSGRADNIDPGALSAEDRLNLDLFKRTLSFSLKLSEFNTHLAPLDHMSGPHIDFPQITAFHPFGTEKDFENYVSRLHAFPVQIDQVIENMKRGVSENYTSFFEVIAHVEAQLKTFAELDVENHPLNAPLITMDESIPEEARDRIKKSVSEAIGVSVTPAYKKLYEFIRKEYAGHCRKDEGLWSLPRGQEMYRYYTRYHTTTDMTPEEIHEIGLSEVSRISIEIKGILEKLGFSGDIAEFAEAVKERKELFPESGEEIMKMYREILAKMDQRLPEYFGRLPKAEYDIKQIEEYREQAAPAAYYYPPPRNFSRPGYFYANTYNPSVRPKFVMEALAYHEAVPGHHLQIAIMQELEHLPEFRRHEGSTAFIEGWALYAEKLADEMGCYSDDYSRYGRMTFELWRAVRLVIDTGIHYFKWSREKSIQYCRDNTDLDDHEIMTEVDRYIAMPGQALAYKIGELKILELRGEMEKVQGRDFRLKDFHDRLLEHGALPLDILQGIILNR
ncbi:MAG: DUF885 domain-containing protein [Nitrospira sp.]|nr:DUF885 domain-containing protein [bacterium]MBL7048264.1 DUF885 domain-containing protein [Nitrospira sp.]